MKYVIATNNMDKLKEMQELMSELGIDAESLYDAGINIEIEETGSTFTENALIKAKAVCQASGLPSIADDSGLLVEALNDAPGVYSNRYGGGGLDGEGLCAYLLSKMEGMEQRDAKFVSSIVCVFPNGNVLTAEGECRGEITTAPRGSGGFGYDPVFQVEGMGKTMAELTPEEKNAVSHRGGALRKFSQLLTMTE